MEPSRANQPRPTARQLLDRLGVAVLDVVYPKRCAQCRERGHWVCEECLANVSLFSPPLCAGCGVPANLLQCRCDEMAPGLSGVRSVGPYDGWLRESVLNFKYYDEWARVEQLAECLARVVADLAPAGGLVPVPLHPSRLRSRGYNQSALLANAVSERLGIPIVEAVQRIRATDQQARLSGAQRVVNVEGAFAVTPGFDPAGMDLILVDDVITTGSTINACARVLVAGGAASVRAVTLARQLDHGPAPLTP